MSFGVVPTLLGSVMRIGLYAGGASLLALSASLTYFIAVRIPETQRGSLESELGERFEALDRLDQEQREDIVLGWIEEEDLLVSILLATMACSKYELSSCADERIDEAIERSANREIGGYALAPMRIVSSACVKAGGERCPPHWRVLNEAGYYANARALIERTRAAFQG